MHKKCLSFWCYTLLFIVSFLKFQFFVIGEQDDNLIARQEFHLNFMRENKIRLSDERYLITTKVKNYIKDNDNKSFSHEFTNPMINENINLEQTTWIIQYNKEI